MSPPWWMALPAGPLIAGLAALCRITSCCSQQWTRIVSVVHLFLTLRPSPIWTLYPCASLQFIARHTHGFDGESWVTSRRPKYECGYGNVMVFTYFQILCSLLNEEWDKTVGSSVISVWRGASPGPGLIQPWRKSNNCSIFISKYMATAALPVREHVWFHFFCLVLVIYRYTCRPWRGWKLFFL